MELTLIFQKYLIHNCFLQPRLAHGKKNHGVIVMCDSEGLSSQSCPANENPLLSTSIYDLVLIYVCHFLHHHPDTFLSNHGLLRYSCLHLGSLHPRILLQEN